MKINLSDFENLKISFDNSENIPIKDIIKNKEYTSEKISFYLINNSLILHPRENFKINIYENDKFIYYGKILIKNEYCVFFYKNLLLGVGEKDFLFIFLFFLPISFLLLINILLNEKSSNKKHLITSPLLILLFIFTSYISIIINFSEHYLNIVRNISNMILLIFFIIIFIFLLKKIYIKKKY